MTPSEKLKAAQAAAKARAQEKAAATGPATMFEATVYEGKRKASDGMIAYETLLMWFHQVVARSTVRKIVIHLEKPEDVYLGSMKGDT